VRTIFNFLGPLTNPAGARRQLVGVADPTYLEAIAGVLARLGVDRALVVSSDDGLDEISTSAATRIVEVNGDQIDVYSVTPQELGVELAGGEGLEGGDPQHNAAVTRAVLAGEPGPARDLALVNAGATIYVAGRAATLAEGVDAARAAVDDGSAAGTLEAFIAATLGGA
jgi:anthranilate phosphoribosyltransferase